MDGAFAPTKGGERAVPWGGAEGGGGGSGVPGRKRAEGSGKHRRGKGTYKSRQLSRLFCSQMKRIAKGKYGEIMASICSDGMYLKIICRAPLAELTPNRPNNDLRSPHPLISQTKTCDTKSPI